MREGVCSLPGCGESGRARCSRCKAWYCSQTCQAHHWPKHLFYCFPLPPLEWPDLVSTNTEVAGMFSDQEKMEINLKEEEKKSVINDREEKKVTVKKDQETVMVGVKTSVITDKKEEVKVKKIQEVVKAVETDVTVGKEPVIINAVEEKKNVITIKDEKEEVQEKNNNPSTEEQTPKEAPKEKAAPASSSGQYKAAVSSPQMTAQEVPRQLTEVTVEHVVSPSEFTISLAAESSDCKQLQGLINDVPPPVDSSWSVGRKEPVLALHQEVWYRGLPLKKKGEEFAVFLLDLGQTVTVRLDNLRALLPPLYQIPPFAYQVCLSGIGPKDGKKFSADEIEDFKTLVGDPTYVMMVEFVGQLAGGRWLVRLQGKDDQEDLGRLMLEVDIGEAKEDPPSTLPTEKTSSSVAQSDPVPTEQVQSVTEKDLSKVLVKVKCPVVGSPEMTDCEGTVRCLESLFTFYILPSSSQGLLASITELAQGSDAVQAGLQAETVPGTCCLARHSEDGLYYRAEIRELCQDGATVKLFLIDLGKMVEEDVKLLRPLSDDLAEVPSLLIKVSLRGMKPLVTWSEEEEEVATTVYDVGGGTSFQFTDVKFVDGKWFVNAADCEGNDLASLLLQCGFTAENCLTGSALTPAVLKAGKQKLVVVSCVSPLQIFMTDTASLEEFTQGYCTKLNQMGETSDYVHLPQVGDLVLVFTKDESWNRATVVEILSDNSLVVELMDFPEVIEVEKKMVRKAPQEALEFPVFVAKCCLDSFYGKEEEAVKQVDKLRSLGLDFSEVEGEVLSSQDGVTRVKVPSVESQLTEPEPAAKSSREAILKKLMKK